ncbi:MAG: hypothetical protein QE277_08020, partial [Flectobacillus sp.]|nr:hypothetical protein [Flectobacillus sp.]
MFKRLSLTILTLFLCKLLVGQSISSNSPLCSDDTPTLELKATGGNTYAWIGPNGFTSSLQNPSIAKVSTSQAGTYTCIIDGKTTLTTNVKIGSSNSSTSISYYTSNAQLVVYATNNTSDMSSISFDWTGPNNLRSTSNTVTINGYEKTNAGTYTVAIKDDFGCSFTKSTNVTINDCSYNPYIYTSIPDKGQGENSWGASGSTDKIFACDGTNIRYRVDTTYWGNNVKIQWFKNDKAIDNANGLTYTSSEAATFYAQLTKGNCVYTTQKLSCQNIIFKPIISNLNDNNNPSVSFANICVKGGFVFLYTSLSSILANDISYQWFKDGKRLTGNTSSSITATQAGEYHVKITVDNCGAISERFTVTLSEKPDTKFRFGIRDIGGIAESTKTLNLCTESASSVFLIMEGTGNKTLFKDGSFVKSITITPDQYYDNPQMGNYIFENKQGECITRDTLSIKFGKKTDIFTDSSFYTSCNPSNSKYFYVRNTSNITPTSGLTWYKNGQVYNTGRSISPSFAGVFQVKYENSTSGCIGESSKITFTPPTTHVGKQFSLITPSSKKKITLCKGLNEAAPLLVKISSPNGVWKKNGQLYDTNPYHTIVSSTGKYWYEVNAGTNCTFYSDTLEVVEQDIPKLTLTQTCGKENSVKLSVNKVINGNYNWYQNSVALANSDTVLSVTKGGVYQVEVMANGCLGSSNTLDIDIPQLNLAKSCNDNIIKLTVNKVSTNSYKWNLDGVALTASDTILSVTKEGIYQVEALVNDCWISSNKVTIGVSLASSIKACTSDSLKLQATGDATSTYNWTGPNNFKSTLLAPVILKTTKNQAGIYKLAATDKTGCTFTAQTNVTVEESPAFSLAKSFAICAGSNFELYKQVISKPLTDSTETVSYSTFLSPGSSSYNRYLSLSNVTAKDAGIYQVKVYPSSGSCVMSTTTQVFVNTTDSCRSISSDYKETYICAEQTADITFKTTGNFKSGTLFRAYYNNGYYDETGVYSYRKVVVGTATKSPIKVSGLTAGYQYPIYIESEDGVSGVGYQYIFTHNTSSNAIVNANGYNNKSGCTALSLRLSNYTTSYNTKQWYLNGDTLKNATSTFITASKTGKYTFIGIDNNGCKSSFSKEIVIGQIEKPVINTDDKTYQIGCFKDYITLYTSSPPNTQYSWKRDGITLLPTSASIYAITPGKYVVEAINGQCKASSDTLIIKQNSSKAVSLTAEISEYSDGTASIYEKSLSTGTSKLYKDNVLYKEGYAPSFKINDEGKYFLKIIKGDCEAVTNIVNFTKKPSSPPVNGGSLDYSGSYDHANKIIEVCDTNTVVRLYASTAYNSSTIKSHITTVYRNERAIVNPTINITATRFIILYVKSAGIYYVTDEVTFSNGTKTTYRYGDMTIKVSSTINLGSTATQNTTICADSTVIYADYDSPSQRPIVYNWKKDGMLYRTLYSNDNPSTLLVKESGTYILETTYKGGCIAKSSPYKITLSNMTITLTDEIEGKLCDSDNTTINGDLSGLSTTSSTNASYQIFKDGKEQINGVFIPNEAGTFNIPINIREGGTYTLKAQQGKCQGTSNDLIIKSIKVPNTINYADSALFCQGKTITLKTTQDTAISYLWERDGNYLTTATKASLDVNNSGVYRSLNRMGDCWNYTPKVITKALPNILSTATISGDKDINYNDSTKVAIAFTSYAPWTFKFSDGKEYTATKSPFSVSVKPQFTTTYSLT